MAGTKSYNCNYPQLVRDAGFKLRQYKDGPLDWRLMGSYEIERIMRDQNFEQVDCALYHLSEAPLGSVLETNILDSGIAKYFVMSQFAIQYLLFCRKFLDEMVGELREAHAAAQLELGQLRKSHAESNNEIVQLHKKITQIEAIREVVYPCHLCTKNFISNEALNIHIGRKHNARTRGAVHERVCGGGGGGTAGQDTPTSGLNVPKEKDTDMTLINTIKMELEIKQLKERLNAAEKNIKERSTSSSQRKSTTPKQEAKDVRSIGIQNNLMDAKEKDDLSDITESEASEQKEQLHDLQERISSFENWQERLKLSNEQFINEINQKLENLTLEMNSSKQQRTETAELEGRASPALENLERVLMQKVSEIGKASAAKLEEVVHQMEMGYKQKLEQLERDLKRLSANKTQIPIRKVEDKKDEKQTPEDDISRIKRQVETAVRAKYDENTYSIEDMDKKEKPQEQATQSKQKPSAEALPTPSSDSNRTFVKSDEVLKLPKTQVTNVTAIAQPPSALEQDTTDISESLNDDDSMGSDESSAQQLSEQDSIDAQKPKTTKPEKSMPKKLKKQKPFTRKDAKKLVNKCLSTHGFDIKSGHITNATLKRVNIELTDQRNKLRLKYPQFYVTRNRIKKFVDKLCSDKMPEYAESILKYKKPLQPIEALNKHVESVESASDGSTQSNESSLIEQKDDFRSRLDRLLSTPVNTRSMTVAQVHGGQSTSKPVPLPRKRVMFNTMGKTFDDGDN